MRVDSRSMTTRPVEPEIVEPRPRDRVASLFRRSHGDRVFRGLLTVAAVIIPLLLALLIWQLWGEAHPAVSRMRSGGRRAR